MTPNTSKSHQNQPAWVVLKFGGTSVSSAGNWQTIASQILDGVKSGKRMMVVHSALADVSNQLELIADASEDFDPGPLLEQIRLQHRNLAAEFDLDADIVLTPSRI